MYRRTRPFRSPLAALGTAVLVTALAVAIAIVAPPATADAAVITSWSGAQPAGFVTASLPVTVRGSSPSDGFPLVSSSARLFVDGVLIPRSSYTASIGSTSAYFYYVPQPQLVDGAHTFRVEVSDTAGRLSFHQWSATVGQPPTAAWIAPARGSVVYSGKPTITMALSDNTPTTTFAVSGQARAGSATGPVAATFGGTGLAGGHNSFALSGELAPGAYYLTATVVDAAGNSRTLQGMAALPFIAESLPAMSLLETCDACHPTYSVAHPTPATTDCFVCHPGYEDHMQGTDYCEDCHWQGWHNDGAGQSVAVSSPCLDCHSPARDDIPRHTDASTYDAHLPAADTCSVCHSSGLIGQHSTTPEGSSYALQCDVCHASGDPLVSGAIADSDRSCLACHPNADHEAFHIVTIDADCSGCHAGTSLSSVHQVTTCAGCHESESATVLSAIDAGLRECSACHGSQPHPGLEALHGATVSSGPVDVFDYHEGYSPITWDVPCTLCHASVNLIAEHGGSCAACHNGTKPADSFEVWSKGCQQGACHVTIDHPSADAAHNGYDCEAACHEPSWYVYYGSCDACHNPSAAAPKTSSNVKTAYVGSAAITMSAPGIAWTYYRLDGGPRMSGDRLTVAGPETGTASHTLEYWSVDDAGHEELPHKTATFTVAADTTPPITSSNVKIGYTGPATIVLWVTDNNSSPVQGTYWRLDGGMQVTGTMILVPQPATGQQAHTLEFWSVDASGNEELPHKTAVFTVTADNTAPTGSIVIAGDATYTRTQAVTLTLSASDVGGSGVTAMRFSNDNSTWSAWQAYGTTKSWTLLAGNGMKTVRVQYRDVAGNVGAFSDTITFDNTAPTGSIAINGGATSTNTLIVTLSLSATDALSGVADMRFSNNGSTWSAWEAYATSKEWTLATGTGTRYAYVQFRDVAGNLRQYSKSITVTGSDTIAPTGSVSIDAGATYTNTVVVELALTATDTGGSGLYQMRFSNDNKTWSSWETYAAARAWTLSAGDGAKTVYVQYRDVAGNVGACSDGITLDGTAPTGSILIDSGASLANTTSVTLGLSAADTGGAGVTRMQFSNDETDWSAWETFAASRTWTVPAGDGVKTVYVRYRDGAGNVSATFSDEITLDSAAVPVNTAALTISTSTWVDANLGASGAWGTYRIYVNDVLVGTKPASSDPTWACPEIALPNGGHIDIVADCGFNNLSWVWDESRPHTYTLALPAGTTRLEASTWTGFPALDVFTDWYDDYDDDYECVVIWPGAISNITYVSSVFFDTTPPSGTITINDGASSINGTAVTLGLSASDAGGTGVSQMQFSNNNTNWTAWEKYATSKSWSLTPGDGEKTVYVRYRDVAGNVSAAFSDTITLDTSKNATLAFVWHPAGWAEARLRVTDASGVVIADKYVSGYGTALDLNVTVLSGQDYYMECVYYYDDDTEDDGGRYGIWTSDTSINADGVLAPAETVTWEY